MRRKVLLKGTARFALSMYVACGAAISKEEREAHDGATCERCGAAVSERVMRQWFLRITAYAERLLAGLDGPRLARAGQAAAAPVDRPLRGP